MNKESYQTVTRVQLLTGKAQDAIEVLDNYRNAVIDFVQSNNTEVTRLAADLADRTRSEQDYGYQLTRISEENDLLSDQLKSRVDEVSSLTGKVFDLNNKIADLEDDLSWACVRLWMVATCVAIVSAVIGVVL